MLSWLCVAHTRGFSDAVVRQTKRQTRMSEESVLDRYSTEFPPSSRHKGIYGSLYLEALEEANNAVGPGVTESTAFF